VNPLADFVSAALAERANPSKAVEMAAYMKTTMPFYGVQTTERRKVLRQAQRRHPIADRDDYRGTVVTLWERPHREEKYCAVDLAIDEKRWIAFDNLDLYRRLIVEGAWWDFVDGVAAQLVGQILVDQPGRMWPILDTWIDDENMWLRRSALLAQLKHKGATDRHRLFAYCLRRADESEFFIRKAIGWALREYAKTDPDAVRDFLDDHREELSGLSYREAAKHL
jgi:3-methyladenine DNA glycosylase AlkD